MNGRTWVDYEEGRDIVAGKSVDIKSLVSNGEDAAAELSRG
jgi:hypothetical protein